MSLPIVVLILAFLAIMFVFTYATSTDGTFLVPFILNTLFALFTFSVIGGIVWALNALLTHH